MKSTVAFRLNEGSYEFKLKSGEIDTIHGTVNKGTYTKQPELSREVARVFLDYPTWYLRLI